MVTWEQAQVNERAKHNLSYKEGVDHYRKTYEQYFKYLGIDRDLKGKKIAEVGPADFPALTYCKNRGDSKIIEPLPSTLLQYFNIPIISAKAEDVDFSGFDEVWLFNVLQHVVDPNKIVQNAKKAKCVRFFEPINYGTDDCHLHNLTFDMFLNWFDEVNYYPKTEKVECFHQWECAYGTYSNIG